MTRVTFIGLSIFLSICYTCSEPRLDSKQEEWDYYNKSYMTVDRLLLDGSAFVNVDTIKVVKDGFKMIRVYSEKEKYILRQNFPNPFNSSTKIEFQLTKASNVRIDIYNTVGQRIKILINQKMQSGQHRVQWGGTNNGGIPVSSGTYFYQLMVDNRLITKKMLLLK